MRDRRDARTPAEAPAVEPARPAPGRVTLLSQLAPNGASPRREPAAADPFAIHLAADEGVAGASAPLPFHDELRASFGRHGAALDGARAQIGGPAAAASQAIGARAYATGDRVGFASAPDRALAAHEAAHVVQQRAGVALSGGVGAANDAHERHADEVAAAFAAGRSAEPILDRMPGGGAGVQRALQLDSDPSADRVPTKRLRDLVSWSELELRPDVQPDLTVLYGNPEKTGDTTIGLATRAQREAYEGERAPLTDLLATGRQEVAFRDAHADAPAGWITPFYAAEWARMLVDVGHARRELALWIVEVSTSEIARLSAQAAQDRIDLHDALGALDRIRRALGDGEKTKRWVQLLLTVNDAAGKLDSLIEGYRDPRALLAMATDMPEGVPGLDQKISDGVGRLADYYDQLAFAAEGYTDIHEIADDVRRSVASLTSKQAAMRGAADGARRARRLADLPVFSG